MIKRISAILILLTVSVQTVVLAQDLKQALQRMREVYEESDKFHVVMRVEAFESKQAAAPYYNEKADVKRAGDNYLSRLSGNDMLMNERCFVMVDKDAREITYNVRSLKAERETYKDLVRLSLDSILSLYNEPRYLGRNNGMDQFEITQKKGPIGLIGLTINLQTAILSEMIYHYRNGQYVKITFEIFDTHPEFPADTFDEGRYIARAKGRTVAAPAFKQYTVTDASSK